MEGATWLALLPTAISDYSDFVIDEIVAQCSDDLHGAVRLYC